MNMTSVVCSAILCAGLLGTGYFAVNNYSMRHNLVEVKGVAEKKVQSDVCVVTVQLQSVADDPKTASQNCDRDKEKLLVALKNGGLQDHEISNVNRVYYKRDKYKDGKSTGEEEYHINESLSLNIGDFAKVERLKHVVAQLIAQEGIWVNIDVHYSLTDLNLFKGDLLKDAARNAKKAAMDFIEPFDVEVGDMVYLKQGLIEEQPAYDGDSGYWRVGRTPEIILRVVVHAGFLHKHRCIANGK